LPHQIGKILDEAGGWYLLELNTYLKRVNANFSFPFFHGLSACLTSPILWLGNGGIEQHWLENQTSNNIVA
jgi:hypothetical protein